MSGRLSRLMTPEEEDEIREAIDPRRDRSRSLSLVSLARAIRIRLDLAYADRDAARLHVTKLLEERKRLEWAAEKECELYDVGIIADEAEID
jgi:hypothetical protein